jgi:hypothetical protein
VKVHELKCWPASFTDIEDGCKRFDIRLNDRHFQVADMVHLREWAPAHESACEWSRSMLDVPCRLCGRARPTDPLPGQYTGRSVVALVIYVYVPPASPAFIGRSPWPKGLVVLGLELVARETVGDLIVVAGEPNIYVRKDSPKPADSDAGQQEGEP